MNKLKKMAISGLVSLSLMAGIGKGAYIDNFKAYYLNGDPKQTVLEWDFIADKENEDMTFANYKVDVSNSFGDYLGNTQGTTIKMHLPWLNTEYDPTRSSGRVNLENVLGENWNPSDNLNLTISNNRPYDSRYIKFQEESFDLNYGVKTVPEPSTIGLLGTGLALAGIGKGRRRK